jgi:energy-converting hydrogenase A subunit M
MPKSKHPKASEVIPDIQKTLDIQQRELDDLIQKRAALKRVRYELHAETEKAYEELLDKALDGIISEDTYNLEMIILDKQFQKIKDIEHEIEDIIKLQDSIKAKNRELILNNVFINDGDARGQFIKLDPRYSDAEYSEHVFVKKRKAEFDESVDFFNKVLNKDIRDSLPEIQITELGSGGRAFTRNGANTIWLDNDSYTNTLIHELGHNLEFNDPYVRYSANQILAKRTAGEEALKLKDVTGIEAYKDSELTKPDKFFNPYVGKIYNDGYTEVTSMALEYLYKDPEYLYKNDPELFEWIVNVIRGHYD